LSKTDIEYSTHPEHFEELIAHLPDLDGLRSALKARKGFDTDRKTLVEVLNDQYARLGLSPGNHHQLLDSNHFTVVTAHQPSLLTGPLYFIYKICSAINLSRRLNTEISDATIHPLFIIGGEDHDFDEINHLHFFGKTFTWQNQETGAVGRMSQEGLAPVLDEIYEVLGTNNQKAIELSNLIRSCFKAERTYGDAMHEFVARLFEDTELIVLQMDDPRLKGLFTDVIKDELTKQSSSEYINETQKKIEKLGYKPQAYVRDINLFYLDDQMRNRIERTDNGYNIVDTELSFSEDQMLKMVDTHPERFSPNVNLRPVYQEIVLPNIAYIGGGGELAYWLERKSQFEYFSIPFPVLIRRNSALFISKGNAKQRKKLDLDYRQLFRDPEHEISDWVREHAEHEVDLSKEMAELSSTLKQVVAKAEAIDPSFARKVEAFKVKTLKDVEHMEKRLVREEKSHFDVKIGRIRKLYEKLFPDGKLQERYDNFMPIYLIHGKDMFDMLIELLDPLEKGFVIIEE
jgi:bacillithiol biosynthesis cysteine-adding enzyme BshC